MTVNRPQLYRGLHIRKDSARANGTTIPSGYHLVYFTPAVLPAELGIDGTDISYSPGEPFTRRMWAGGQIKWTKGNPLKIGDEAIEITRLVFAEPKITRAGEEMIVVSIEKEFENAKGIALVDRRDWVFRAQLSLSVPSQDYPLPNRLDNVLLPPPNESQTSRDYLQSAVSLFRFSALTFNTHVRVGMLGDVVN